MTSVMMSPGTMADDASIGTVAWTNPDNAKVSDNVYATATGPLYGYTHRLKATNFGFSIPLGATIDGIKVEVELKSSSALGHADNSDLLIKAGVVGGANRGSTDALPTTEAYWTYGGATDLWSRTWTPSDINASDFGFAPSYYGIDASVTVSIDHIRITVYYTEVPPTVALNTPADTATVATLTPELKFTGTDADGDAISYEVQVDTANTFGSTTTYYFDGHTSISDPSSKWTYDSSAFDGTLAETSQASEVGNVISKTSNYLGGVGTTALTSGATITQVRVRINAFTGFGVGLYGTLYSGAEELNTTTGDGGDLNSWGNYVTLTTPIGGWSWTKVSELEIRFHFNGGDTSDQFGSNVGAAEIEVTTAPLLDALSALTAIASPGTVVDVNPIIDSFTTAPDYSDNMSGSSFPYWGQSFTNVDTATLNSVKVLNLKRTASALSGNIVAKIYAHRGTYGTSSKPIGTALATSDNYNITGLTTSYQAITFNFSGVNRINLTASTYYELVLYWGGGDASNYVIIGEVSTGGASGNSCRSTAGTDITWGTSSWDMPFYVYSDAPGTVAWTNPNNAQVSDNVYATIDTGPDQLIAVDQTVKIVKSDGTFGTTNKAISGYWSSTEAYVSYGSSSDLWGETWTPADINDVDFGVGLSILVQSGVYSHYLKATNFGFTIPTGATINGILVEIEKVAGYHFDSNYALVDHVRITVYYNDPSFIDITNSADTDPFASTNQIGYTLQAPLADNTTYYWRARGKDPTGTNTFGAWAATQSFTIITFTSPLPTFFRPIVRG